jgi:GDP-mannose transporter
MLVANKLAVHLFPAPSFVLWAQLAGTALCVKGAESLGLIQCDKLEQSKIKSFAPVAMIFVSTIFLNMKTLQYANVETFIVFRCSTPMVISMADYFFLGRELPSTQSWLSLCGLLVGAIGYALTDSSYNVKGYGFVMMWYFVFCLDQIYLKHIVNTVKMDSNWGRVFYSNFVAALPLMFTAYGSGEQDQIMTGWTVPATSAVVLSIVLGCAMSYFAWLARSLVSATYFTVIGNSCKLLTIVINCTIWDKHASPFGIACLLLCLFAAYFYKQAPLRAQPIEVDEDQVPLAAMVPSSK